MWIKKNSEELKGLEKDNKNDVCIESLLWGLISFLLFSIVDKIGYSKTFVSIDPIPWNEFFEHLPIIFCISLIIAVVYWYFKKDASIFEKKSLICPSCENVKKEDGVRSCECGGTFEDLETMKWVD
ncbi:hypothetical protein KJ966_11590 [bacterium]|nr:hypothetical protein [bacterium]